jgi:hypothetical protein
MHEVHVFVATATAGPGNGYGYAAGDRHALVIFSRQHPGSDHDCGAAEDRAQALAWREVALHRACTLTPEKLDGMDQLLVDCYREAREHGSAVLAYADPVETRH